MSWFTGEPRRKEEEWWFGLTIGERINQTTQGFDGDFSVFLVKEQKTKIKLKVNVQRGGQNALLCSYYLKKKRS